MAAEQAGSLLMVLGLSLAVGWVGGILFRRYRVSDLVLLVGAGLLAGPVLGLVDIDWAAPALLALAPLALVIVLFEGGLELAWDELRRHAGPALLLTFLTWSATVAAVMAVAVPLLGLPLHLALLLAIAVAATGMLAVIPLLAQMRVSPAARTILTMETSLGDLLSAVLTVALASAYALGTSPGRAVPEFAVQLLVGASAGLLAGLVGARMLHRAGKESHAYAATLAALLLAGFGAELIGGSGYVAALVFGLVLGNVAILTRRGGLRDLAPLPASMRLQQSSLLFILRCVFFVFLGLSIPPDVLTPRLMTTVLALTAAVVAARVASVLLCTRSEGLRRERLLLTSMMPRGLAAAALAAVPAAMGVPGTEAFPVYTAALIVGADLATGVGLMVHARRHGRETPADGGAVAVA